ncbi:hypothetical protein [Micromonospora purpureochromogenes]|uniref:Uncharacterized protein n=1 Tax=Micromonospora purpureochromogenes TaxID=47872 RepID=A0ABX2RLC8_9ACTN|nr:hypothetical protein [Micromonospora purpureochromogenes]NYF57317.1 hypothetical protein [Micromonospora purpureochromogenes]
MRPELAGMGATPQSRAKAASDLSLWGVVAGGDEELPGGVDADAGQGDQVGGYGGDEGGQVVVEVVDLGLEREPAAGEAAQGSFGCRSRIGYQARP